MYTFETITRLTESASISYDWEDDTDNYEIVYVVYDDFGEQVCETKDYSLVQQYLFLSKEADENQYHEPDWSYGENPFDPNDLPF